MPFFAWLFNVCLIALAVALPAIAAPIGILLTMTLGWLLTFWVHVAIYLGAAGLITKTRGIELWWNDGRFIIIMGIWAYAIFCTGVATAPSGRLLPPLPFQLSGHICSIAIA